MKAWLTAGGILAAFLGAIGSAQNQAAGPTFEVASIKPASLSFGGRGRGGFGGMKIDGARLDIPFVSLETLLPWAFRVKDYRVSAPEWTRESLWSISAKLPGDGSQERAPEMMQALLFDRFKLTIHHEKREHAVYTLTVVEGGSKLTVAPEGEYQAWDGSFPGFNFGGPLRQGPPITGRIMTGKNCSRIWEFIPLPMSALADALTMFLGRPVVDQTGMEGKYKVRLEFPPETELGISANIIQSLRLPLPPPGDGGGRKGRGGAGGDAPPPRVDASGCVDPVSLSTDSVAAPDPAIIKALQQLGLKLQQGRAPIDTIVVDHLEKTPTEN